MLLKGLDTYVLLYSLFQSMFQYKLVKYKLALQVIVYKNWSWWICILLGLLYYKTTTTHPLFSCGFLQISSNFPGQDCSAQKCMCNWPWHLNKVLNKMLQMYALFCRSPIQQISKKESSVDKKTWVRGRRSRQWDVSEAEGRIRPREGPRPMSFLVEMFVYLWLQRILYK